MNDATRSGSRDPCRDLTVVLTLKDRVPYTLRWMEYANSGGFPFKVLVADGGSDDRAQALLSDKRRFPNVDYDYVRYSTDRTYADYYAKMADALAKVETPYVAMADNDDFFVVDSLRESVRFLGAHDDYVSCGGQGAIFWMQPASAHDDPDGALYGRDILWKATREADSVDAATARERLRAVSLSKSDTFYYDVKRTPVARRIVDKVRELGLKDLFLVEHLIWHLVAVAGKTRRLGRLYLARQQDSPGSSGAAHQETFGDWIGRMLVETWSGDFAKFLETVSAGLAAADALTVEEARRCVIRSYRASIAPSLLSDLMNEPTVNAPMSGVVAAVRRVVGLPERSLVRRIGRQVYRRLPWISLDIVYGTEFVATPVPNARADFKPILDFLGRQG